jgi:hypothetical protein
MFLNEKAGQWIMSKMNISVVCVLFQRVNKYRPKAVNTSRQTVLPALTFKESCTILRIDFGIFMLSKIPRLKFNFLPKHH